jgi:hypothetical protein
MSTQPHLVTDLVPPVIPSGDRAVEMLVEAEGVPAYPFETIDGDSIGELSRELTTGTFIPPQFVREIVKTALGSVVNGLVGYSGEEDLHCRQYTMNVSVGPEVGKGQSWKRTLAAFGALTNLVDQCGVKIIDGTKFGSGEYMVRVLKQNPVAIARFDEMSAFWSKSKALASVLEQNLTTLFEQGEIAHGSFKNGEDEVKGISLSFVGDFTKTGLEDSFRGRGSRGSGYLSRGVYQFSDRIPHHGDFPRIDAQRVDEILDRMGATIDWLKAAEKTAPSNGFGGESRWIIPEDQEATRLRLEFDAWLRTQDWQYTPRLAAHLKRDALLRGLFSPEKRITAAVMKLSIQWCKNQLANRVALWPADTGSQVSIMEQKILEVLGKRGRLAGNNLKKLCHAYRPSSGGLETFNRAIKALLASKDIHICDRTQKGFPVYALCQE